MIQIYPVDAGVWRGPRPQTPEDFEFLQAQGIKTILNLETGLFDLLTKELNYQSVAALVCGLLPITIQFSAIEAPEADDLDAALKVISLYSPIYFHCKAGVDRTGALAASYRVKVQGWTVDRAVEEWKQMGFHQFPYKLLGWERAVRKYLA